MVGEIDDEYIVQRDGNIPMSRFRISYSYLLYFQKLMWYILYECAVLISCHELLYLILDVYIQHM